MRIFLAALVWIALTISAHAQSTINPALPAAGQPYSSSVIRGQFDSAYSDINTLYGLQQCSPGSTPPTSPARGMCWLNTSTSIWVYNLYDDIVPTWVTVTNIDSTNGLNVPPIGGGTEQTLASSSTVNLGSVPQSLIQITGTTPISSFGGSAKAGQSKLLYFAGALTLTQSSALLLPGAANITTAAGDTAIAVTTGSGNWLIISYQRVSGGPIVLTFAEVVAALGYTPLNPANNLSDVASRSISATTITAAPHVATNAVLLTACTAASGCPGGNPIYTAGLWRDTYGGAISPPVFYTPSGSPCSLNAGSGDNGYQVRSADGKCWIGSIVLGDVTIWGALCDGSTDDKNPLLAAIVAANAAGFSLSWPNRNCYSSGQIAFGGVPVHGAARLVASNPPAGPHLTCPATLAAPCAVFGTTGANGLLGGAFDNLWVSYSGSPIAGDAAFEIIGSNSTYTNVLASNAYDGFQFGSGTFGDSISAHGDHLYTWKIVHDHIVLNSTAEIFIENYRLGINGVGDVASHSFVGITGYNTNTISFSHGVMALGLGVTSYVIDFAGITNQANGIYNFTDAIIDASLGANSIIHSDGSGTCFRCAFNNVNVVGALSSMFTFAGGTPPMNETTFANSNFFVSDFTFPTANYTALSVSNVYVSGTFTLAASGSGSGASLSNIQTGGAMAIGGPWGRLNMSNITAPTYTDTASGPVYASGVPPIAFTPVLTFGGGSTGLTYTSRVGTATRNSDGTFTAQYGFQLTAPGSSTGNAAVSGLPYTCAAYGLGSSDPRLAYTGTLLSLTGPVVAAGNATTSQFLLSETNSTGYAFLTQANFQANSFVSGTMSCVAQ